ncbi:MAG: hypothetical protein BWK80_12025 [Desulfobacteraceae bacterium IS3]|nr:MAG: hypothetical protein BWK80_12025 [Desulfobacteraceae bacterium IS3]
METKKISGILCTVFFLILMTVFIENANSSTLTLIDFGAAENQNIFGLAGWNTAIKDKYTNYIDPGEGLPKGTAITVGNNGDYDYQGVQGNPRAFAKGEEILVTWYNHSDKQIIFTPRISFAHAGRFEKKDAWRNMSETVVPAKGTAISFFDITDSSVGTYSLVNVNVNYANNKTLICDKIELTDEIDTEPPPVPRGIKGKAESSRTADLTWEISPDSKQAAGYRLYRNGLFLKVVTEKHYSDTGLLPSTEYSYTITAFDNRKNESAHSEPFRITTRQREASDLRIYPSPDFVYKGAFRFPEGSNGVGWAYGARGMAYYPGGDPEGTDDGYPGSIFASGWKGDVGMESYVSEISIPAPVISPNKDINDLNTAGTLQKFQDIVRDKFQVDGASGDTCGDIAYLPRQGAQTSGKLYSAWGKHYQFYHKAVSHSWCELNLSDPKPQGGWYIGPKNGRPINFSINSYLFSIPPEWAAANTPGKLLATGRYKDGGLSGRGPSLYAYGPWNEGNPPPPNAELSYTTLLQYSLETDYTSDPSQSMKGWSKADGWSGGEWLTAGKRSAVIFVGVKGIGKDWYGLQDGTLHSKDHIKGRWAEETRAQILFYDTEELAAVAHGKMQPYEPQPYSVMDIEAFMYKKRKWINQHHLVWSVCFDRDRGFLYLVESEAYGKYGDGNILMHVWKVTVP